MNDACNTPSETGRAMARARWGTTRLDRMIGELADRTDEMGDEQVRGLARALARAVIHTHEGEHDHE